jgi:hypothetical protein
MIEALKLRARRARPFDRIDARVAPATSIALKDFEVKIDSVLAFAVVHEMPSAESFFVEAAQPIEPGAQGGYWWNASVTSARRNSIESSLSLRNMVS